jgi:hypothetical protein
MAEQRFTRQYNGQLVTSVWDNDTVTVSAPVNLNHNTGPFGLSYGLNILTIPVGATGAYLSFPPALPNAQVKVISTNPGGAVVSFTGDLYGNDVNPSITNEEGAVDYNAFTSDGTSWYCTGANPELANAGG